MLNKEQKKAARALERAFKKCADANIVIHNCYGTLTLYNGELVRTVDDDDDTHACHDTDYAYEVEDHGYCTDLVSWADDAHYIHLHGSE